MRQNGISGFSNKVALLLGGKLITIFLPMGGVETIMRLIETSNGNVWILIPDFAETARAEKTLSVAPEVPIMNLNLHDYREGTVSNLFDIDRNIYMEGLVGASAHSV